MVSPRPIFRLFWFFSHNLGKRAGFSRIRSRIVEVERKHADHTTTTTALVLPILRSLWTHLLHVGRCTDNSGHSVGLKLLIERDCEANKSASETLTGKREKEKFFKRTKVLQKLKMGHPRPLLCLFPGLFRTNITNFYNKGSKKLPSNIQCWVLNPRPSGHESPLIITRQGSRPMKNKFGNQFNFQLLFFDSTVWPDGKIIFSIPIWTFVIMICPIESFCSDFMLSHAKYLVMFNSKTKGWFHIK